MQALLLGYASGIIERVLEIVAMFDQFAAPRAHGGILFGTVSMGNDDDDAQTCFAAGIGDALAMIAPCRRDDATDFGFPLP